MSVRNNIFAAAAIFFCACGGGAGNLVAETPVQADSLAAAPAVPAEEKIVVTIERQLLYDKYTLPDTIPYRDTVRIIQWEKIRMGLAVLDSVWRTGDSWGVLQNRGNKNGQAPLAAGYTRNNFNNVTDDFGVERYQGIPLYDSWADAVPPRRYGQDGWLVKIVAAGVDSARVEPVAIASEWIVPQRYLHVIAVDTLAFDHAVFVDRLRQYVVTLERERGHHWLVRSINPATTGLHKPPYQKETPLGIFVIQEKKARMVYLEDGTTVKGGFAPYASRFSNGGYLHGIPVNAPRTGIIEYSPSLGTTPRSHMCVRNATSHAKFLYDRFPVFRTVVFVIE